MAWAGAAITAGGALLGNLQSTSAANYTTGASRDFARDMRDTQWWATVRDMKNAGINPMLAVSKGPTSSAGAQSHMPQIENIGAAGMQGYSAQQTADLQRGQRENLEAQKKLMEAQALAALSNSKHFDQLVEQSKTQIKSLEADIQRALADMGLKNALARSESIKWNTLNAQQFHAMRYYAAQAAELEAKAKLTGLQIPEAIKVAAMWNSEFGTMLPYAERGLGVAGSAVGSAAKAAIGYRAMNPKDYFKGGRLPGIRR